MFGELLFTWGERDTLSHHGTMGQHTHFLHIAHANLGMIHQVPRPDDWGHDLAIEVIGIIFDGLLLMRWLFQCCIGPRFCLAFVKEWGP